VRGLVWSDKGEHDKAPADWEKALAITPNDWKLLNNLGVGFWQRAQEQDSLAAKAEAAGDLEAAKACRQKSAALKDDAKAKRIHVAELVANGCPAVARNTALKLARGDFIAYLAPGDEYYPDYLAKVPAAGQQGDVLLFRFDIGYEGE
jgi:glycosyltransferase involved in cell wall biosynthesis